MAKSVTERLIQYIDDDEFDIYCLLMDMIYLVGEEKLAQYVKETNAFPESDEDDEENSDEQV
jgi:hypothetical protein